MKSAPRHPLLWLRYASTPYALGIRSIPSLILFEGGREIARQSGALPLPQLLAWLADQGR